MVDDQGYLILSLTKADVVSYLRISITNEASILGN